MRSWISTPLSAARRAAPIALALLACTVPAAAQAPSAAETMDYIRANCETEINRIRNRSIRFEGGRFGFRVSDGTSYNPGGVGVNYQYFGRSFAIKDVEFRENSEFGFIVACISADCISEYDYRDESNRYSAVRERAPNAYMQRGGRGRTSLLINCHQADRVVRAFRHLQQLHGGPAVDPFAN